MVKYTDEEELWIAKLLFELDDGYEQEHEDMWDSCPRDLYEKLYEEFADDMPFTTYNGDEGTFDDWFWDNLELVKYRFEHL